MPPIGDGDGDEPAVNEPHRVAVTWVIDYSPAPGQFVNELPLYLPGDNHETMAAKACKALNEGGLVTLGALGGSITVELGEVIKPRVDAAELRVVGNAISNGSEPGIVWVSSDGLQWYPLEGEAGWQLDRETTVTYHAPDADTPDKQHIAWQAQSTAWGATTGYIPRLLMFHEQPYYPQWVSEPTITKRAMRLPDNGKANPETGQVDFTPLWGYADSYPNSSAQGLLDLDNAIDPATGQRVSLPEGVRYVRVVTGMLQMNGALGESSTEVGGFIAQ